MTMKIKTSGLINYWKLFLLRYLLLDKGAVDLGVCLKEATKLLRHFLDLTQELGLKNISAGVTEQTEEYLLDKYKKSEQGLIRKAIDRNLTLKDLHLLSNYSDASHNDVSLNLTSDIISNLIIVFDFKQSEKKIKNIFDACLKSILQKKLKTHKRMSLTTNFYSYYYQKNHFIKFIPHYLEECASDEINLLEGRSGKLFGEEDYRTTFLETLLLLEREGIITITRMGVAESESLSLTTITTRVNNLFKTSAISQKTAPSLAPQLPKGWDLKIDECQPQITNFNQVVFTFPNNWSNKYRYFICLWKNYGQKVDYKTIYEFESGGQTYPGREKPWKVNRRIRDTITKLKSKFAKLPINIEISKGFTLTIN